MAFVQRMLAAAVLVCLCTPMWGQPQTVENGGDTFIAGPQITGAIETLGDTFLTARTVQPSGMSQGDLHISGYDVSVGADIARDLYAMGATVVIRGNVGEDITAMGFSVRTDPTSQTSGNVRLLGHTVTIDGPVGGALSVAARDVVLNAPIQGDVQIVAQTLSFGPDAVVDGILTYETKDPIAVPERVAPSSRVVFHEESGKGIWDNVAEFKSEIPAFPTVASLISGFVISLLFFVVLGALVLGVMPRRLESLRQSVVDAPGQSLMLGVIGLSMLFGMVPILALTIVGLPFVPVVLLGIIVAWIFGYALGAYSIAMRIWTALGTEKELGNTGRILVFAAAIIIIALLNFIPFVGWVVNYTLVLLGFGAMTRAIFQSLIGNPGPTLDVDLEPIKD